MYINSYTIWQKNKNKTHKVHGAKGPGSVQITWPMLVKRMVTFIELHNYDKDETNCLRVMRVLRSHLVKARSEEVKSTYVSLLFYFL